MSNNAIYASYAYKYLESGFGVFPCEPKSKKAFLKNWSQYCNDTSIGSQDVDFWAEEYPKSNIGLPLGSQNGVIAIDIDTNDQDVIAKIPRSPYVKVGAKGETRFFKYDPNLRARKFNYKGSMAIEILTAGNQTIMPPSIHPNGKPYRWIGTSGDICNSIHDEPLPELPIGWIDELEAFLAESGSAAPVPATLVIAGRNNKLKDICSAKVFAGASPEEVIRELVEYDKNNHIPPLFSDANEGFFAKSPDDLEKNARKFYTSIATGIWKKDPSTLRFDQTKLDIQLEKMELEEVSDYKIAIPEYDIPQKSFFTYFMKWCRLNSNSNIDALSLGGAIALLSAVLGNRVRASFGQYDVRPNLFVFNIAPSGCGKSTPQNLIKKLVGSAPYYRGSMFKSVSALIDGLPKQQEQLHVLDEASSLLRNINSRSEFLSEISNTLRELYSCSHSFFSGINSKASGFEHGACHNPYITILASTTNKEFDGHTTSQSVDGGFMPRFLFFRQDAVGDYHNSYNEKESRDILDNLKTYIKVVEETFPKLKKSRLDAHNNFSQETDWGNIYEPTEIRVSEEAMEYFKELQREAFKENAERNSPFYARKIEHVCKLAILSAVGRLSTVIDCDDLDWAVNVWETQYSYSFLSFGAAEANNDFQRLVYNAKCYFSKRTLPVKRSVLYQQLSRTKTKMPLTIRVKKEVVDFLIGDELVEPVKIDNVEYLKYIGKKVNVYTKIKKRELKAWRNSRIEDKKEA